MRTRGIATRRLDAETVRKAREAHDQALHTRGGDDPVATSPETQKKKGGVSTSLTPPASFPPSPPLTVETDDKKTSPPASPVPARHVNVAAQHPVTFTARGTPATWDTRQRVFQQSEGGSPERSESPASSAPNSPTHRDAPPDEASSKTRTVKFSRHVHGTPRPHCGTAPSRTLPDFEEDKPSTTTTNPRKRKRICIQKTPFFSSPPRDAHGVDLPLPQILHAFRFPIHESRARFPGERFRALRRENPV